jgi:hypothetical protein
MIFNPLNAVLNPICHLLALLGDHPILHISRIRVKVFWFSLSLLVILSLLTPHVLNAYYKTFVFYIFIIIIEKK